MDNKKELLNEFNTLFNELTESSINKFSRISNKLLDKTFIIRKKEGDSEDYFFIKSNLRLFYNYFYLLDYEVLSHEESEIIRIKSLENRNRFQLKKIETIVLLILRQLYYSKQKEVSIVKEIQVQVEEIHENIIKTGLIEGKINKTDFQNIMKLFKRYLIVDFKTSSDVLKDDSYILIYPTINYIVNINSMKELTTIINSFKGGDDIEDFDEDQTD